MHLGKLLRTIYLCDYLPNTNFRREIHRALNVGESVHELQRTLCPAMIGPKRARRVEEHTAISASLALLTNLVMPGIPSASKRPSITSIRSAGNGGAWPWRGSALRRTVTSIFGDSSSFRSSVIPTGSSASVAVLTRALLL